MTVSQLSALPRRRALWRGVLGVAKVVTYKGCLIYIVHRRVHVRMEVVFDGDLVDTEFNKILLDYLDMKGRSSSGEDASDEEDSSSGNDSDIGRAISTDIVGDEGVELQPSATQALPTASTSTSGIDVKRDTGRKCMRGDYIDNFGEGEVVLTRTINAGLDKEQMDLLLLGKVSTFIRRVGITRSQKKRAHLWSRCDTRA